MEEIREAALRSSLCDLTQLLKTIKWPILKDPSSPKLFEKRLITDLFDPLLSSNLRTGAFSLLLQASTTVLEDAGTELERILETENDEPLSVSIDSLFGLSQFMFAAMAHLFRKVSWPLALFHLDCVPLPSGMVPLSPGKIALESPSPKDLFSILLCIHRSYLNPRENITSDDPHPDWNICNVLLSFQRASRALQSSDPAAAFAYHIQQAIRFWLKDDAPDLLSQIEHEAFSVVSDLSGSAYTLHQYAQKVLDCVDKADLINSNEPVSTGAIILHDVIGGMNNQPNGARLYNFTGAVTRYLCSSYRPYFFSNLLPDGEQPMALRIETHKSLLALLVMFCAMKARPRDLSSAFSTSVIGDMHKLTRSEFDTQEAKANDLKWWMKSFKSVSGLVGTTIALSPPTGPFIPDSLDQDGIGYRLVLKIICQASPTSSKHVLSNGGGLDFIYYIINMIFLSIPMTLPPSEPVCADLYKFMTSQFPTLLGNRLIKMSEICSFSTSIATSINWMSPSQMNAVAYLPPMLMFDRIPISLRLAASSILVIMASTSAEFRNMLSMVENKAILPDNCLHSPRIFYKDSALCFGALINAIKMKSQSALALLVSLSSSNEVFGLSPLLIKSGPALFIDVLQILSELVMTDKSQTTFVRLSNPPPSLNALLTLTLRWTRSERFLTSLFLTGQENLPPPWLFMKKTDNSEELSKEMKRVAGIQKKHQGITHGDILIHVLLKISEWNLRGCRDLQTSDLINAHFINLRRFKELELHWRTCDLICASIEAWSKLLCNRFEDKEIAINPKLPQALIEELQSQHVWKLSGLELITSHLEIIASHLAALINFVAAALLPENVSRNSKLLYTIARRNSVWLTKLRGCLERKEKDAFIDPQLVEGNSEKFRKMLNDGSTDPGEILWELHEWKLKGLVWYLVVEVLTCLIWIDDIKKVALMSQCQLLRLTESWKVCVCSSPFVLSYKSEEYADSADGSTKVEATPSSREELDEEDDSGEEEEFQGSPETISRTLVSKCSQFTSRRVDVSDLSQLSKMRLVDRLQRSQTYIRLVCRLNINNGVPQRLNTMCAMVWDALYAIMFGQISDLVSEETLVKRMLEEQKK